jgi:hypothetical protein
MMRDVNWIEYTHLRFVLISLFREAEEVVPQGKSEEL